MTSIKHITDMHSMLERKFNGMMLNRRDFLKASVALSFTPTALMISCRRSEGRDSDKGFVIPKSWTRQGLVIERYHADKGVSKYSVHGRRNWQGRGHLSHRRLSRPAKRTISTPGMRIQSPAFIFRSERSFCIFTRVIRLNLSHARSARWVRLRR